MEDYDNLPGLRNHRNTKHTVYEWRSSFLPPLSFFLSIHILKGTISKQSGCNLWREDVAGEAFLSSLQVLCEGMQSFCSHSKALEGVGRA